MQKTLVLCLILGAAHGALKAQYYNLRDVNGKEVRVHVQELRRDVRVTCAHDTLLLEAFGWCHARALNSHFVEITYTVRGGSGLGLEYTAILAVRDGRLRQALLVNSSLESVDVKYHEVLNTGFRLTGDSWSNYVLTLNAFKYLRDASHPAGIHKRYRPVVLRFNKDLMAFYGKTTVASSAFNIRECNQSIECIHLAAGDTLRMVELADYPYYYVEGLWYSPVDERLLLQEDTVIDKVFKLSVVQQKSAWVDSVTHRCHGISLMMLQSTNWPSDTGHYVLQAGYRSLQRFDPYYLFKVYQPDLAIKTFTPPFTQPD